MKMRYALIEFDDECPEELPGATVLMRSSHDPRPSEARAIKHEGMLYDLSRCEHGRHEGDSCSGCGGVSAGNPVPADDRIVGFDISGRAIFIPRRGEKWEYASADTNGEES